MKETVLTNCKRQVLNDLVSSVVHMLLLWP